MSIYCTIAVHIAPIAKPISANLEPFTLNFDINIVKIILIINAPAKEPNGNMNKGADGNNMIIVTADKLAPLVIPITSGKLAHFLQRPVLMRQKWQGYYLQLMLKHSWCSIFVNNKIILCKRLLTASNGLMNTAPMERDAIDAINNNTVTSEYRNMNGLIIAFSPLLL